MNKRDFLKMFVVAPFAGTVIGSVINHLSTKPEKWFVVSGVQRGSDRKLKAVWSTEAEQDLQCWYNIEPYDELIKMPLTENLKRCA